MKIQNISSSNLPIMVSFLAINGSTISVNLERGEFVYTDSNQETKSIIIQVKKGHLKTSQEEKPTNVNLYEVYTTNASGDIIPKVPAPADGSDATLEKYKNEFRIPSTAGKVQQPVSAQASEEVKNSEQTVVKNKGGRPKGSKDTVKRGEPKLKKPAGRPINTNALAGMSLEDVKSKCEARGYTTRITNEDGKSYIITMDLRFDRVNLHVENGVVTKADIG